MSNTSLPNLVATFNQVLWSFSYVILPTCYVLGNIGNVLNLLIFSQRSSRANSCLLYFLSASIINIFILNFGLVLRILRGIWNIDPALKYLWFCRWRTYLTGTFFLIYRCSILLACVDRMCASSRSAWMRLESRPRIAHRLIPITWILCLAYSIPTLIFPVILYSQCLAPPGTTYATYLTISIMVQGLSIPLAMIICGLVTLGHLKFMKTHVAPGNTAGQDERRVTGQYIIMLLVQVMTDCLCNMVYQVYLIYTLIYPAPQTPEITAISTFLINLSFNVPYINYSAGFYLHTLSSPAFRRKFYHLIRRIPWFQRFLLFHPGRHHTHTIPMITLRPGHTTVVIHPTVHN